MWFGPVPVREAAGAILAHSVDLQGTRLRKGRWLDAGDVAALQAGGVAEIIVARLGPGDVHEDAAAARLAAAVMVGATGLRASVAATGRVNLHATARGVLCVDAEAVHELNRIDPAITLATLRPYALVAEGAMVATLKIIPYAVAEAHLARAEAAGTAAMTLAQPVLRRATLIETVAGRDPGPKGGAAVAARLDALGVVLGETLRVPHDAAALTRALAAATGDLVLILTASATSDVQDVAPAAVVRAGGRVHHYGMPVDPGNLLFLGDLRERPVIGLPGCARSPALNGADWVLQRVVCGVPVTAEDIMAMGVGGLLKEIPTRPRPREADEHG